MSVNVAVIYYSATGGVHALAEAVAEGAAAAGADVRLRRVAELAPDTAIDSAASVAEADVQDQGRRLAEITIRLLGADRTIREAVAATTSRSA